MVGRFGGYGVWIATAGIVLFVAASPGRAFADDGVICAEDSGDVAIAACTRAIESRKYSGHNLANKYLNRGVEWKLKKQYDSAIADYNEAIRLDAKFADAYYNRCGVYIVREDFDRALPDCDRAVKLGASSNAIAPNGGGKLGDDRTLSDYYSNRGYIYLSKKDYVHAIADLDDAIRLYPQSVVALRNRGRAWKEQGDVARSNADFEAAKRFEK